MASLPLGKRRKIRMKNWTKNSPYRNKDKDEIADIFYEQFKKHGVRLPETYTEQELIDLNPGVPVWFTKQHMKLKNKNES